MHSIAVASLLAAVATISSAAPTGSGSSAKQPRAWYVCANNGFRGECSSDPCDKHWCPDYNPWTYDPVTITAPPPRVPVPTTTNPTLYMCPATNQFEGHCSINPCDLPWCPDYVAFTYVLHPWSSLNAKRSANSDPTVCAPGTGFFQSCSNGFRGCCKGDACGNSWCPDYKFGTFEPLTAAESMNNIKRRHHADNTVCAPGSGYFQSCSNGFRGCCRSDACAGPDAYCPDAAIAQNGVPVAVVNKRDHDDKTVCAPGTGYFQSCSNGFRGCCKSDACAGPDAYCPDAAIAQNKVESVKRDDTVCAPGTGYFQSCSNGFRGCCKGDACGNSWCPDYN